MKKLLITILAVFPLMAFGRLYLYDRKHALSTVGGIGIKRINYHTPGLKDSYNIFLTLIGVRY